MRLKTLLAPNRHSASIALVAYGLGAGYAVFDQLSYCASGACSAPTWLLVIIPCVSWLPALAGTYLLVNAIMIWHSSKKPAKGRAVRKRARDAQ